MDYPYISITAQDASGNPISVTLRAASDSPVTNETAIVNAMKDHLTGLGVTINAADRLTITQTPV